MPENNETTTFSVNWGLLRSIFDVTWKVIPLLWVVFQYMSNQDQVLSAAKATAAKMVNLETRLNEQDRTMTEIRGDLKALQTELSDTRDFFAQTHRTK